MIDSSSPGIGPTPAVPEPTLPQVVPDQGRGFGKVLQAQQGEPFDTSKLQDQMQEALKPVDPAQALGFGKALERVSDLVDRANILLDTGQVTDEKDAKALQSVVGSAVTTDALGRQTIDSGKAATLAALVQKYSK